MSDNISRTINWSELYDPLSLKNILKEINSTTIQEVHIDKEYKFALIEGTKRYISSFDLTYELIPNEVIIEKDKTLTYINSRVIKIKEYPQILNFILKHTPYINDFINEQNIETVEISARENLTNYDSNNMADRLSNISLVKDWLYRENNKELIPLIFASLIKRFYRQDLNPLKIKTSSILARIKSNIEHVNSLLDSNINELKNYSLNYNTDSCVNIGSTLTEFNFISNTMFRTVYFEMYQQNLDLKFLSYISRADLKEQAIKCRR